MAVNRCASLVVRKWFGGGGGDKEEAFGYLFGGDSL